MENGERYIPETESREVQMIKGFFPEDAKISQNDNGSYLVDATLLDHTLVDGGQKIFLNLSLNVTQGGEEETLIGASVNSFLVNNTEIKENGIDLFLISGDKEVLPQNSDCNLIDPNEDNAANSIDDKVILVRGMKNGFNLALYFHELGHITRNGEDIPTDDVLEIETQIREITKSEISDSALIQKEIENWRKLLYEERRASIKALSLLRDKENIFPNDPGLSKVKKAYEFSLSNYMRSLKVANGQEAIEIVNLDSDWHY